MGDYSCPRKRPRLGEASDDTDFDFALGNDELWGPDDLTAEEFDLLEVQATQAVDRQNWFQNGDQGGQSTYLNGNTTNCQNEASELENLKQEQYALEGKNKALKELLEKTSRDLNDERSNRQQVIDQKLEALKIKEAALQREIEKLQTELDLKEYEVLRQKSKVHVLESKLKKNSEDAPPPANSTSVVKSRKPSVAKTSPNKFLNWHSHFHDKPIFAESGIQTEVLQSRRLALSLQAPKGELTKKDAVCRLLSCKFVDSFSNDYQGSIFDGGRNSANEIFTRARDSSSMCIAAMKSKEDSDDVWRPYEVALQEYVNHMKTEQNKLKLRKANVRTQITEDKCHLASNCQQSCVVSCLKDLTGILFHQCPEQNSRSAKYEKRNDTDLFCADSMPIFGGAEERMDTTESHDHSLLELLVMIASPSTYPKGFNAPLEAEWALAALIAWSSHSKRSLEVCIQDLYLHSLVSGHHGMECAYMTAKLMNSLIGLQNFKEIITRHSGSCCILCSVGYLCQNIHDESPSKSSGLLMNMVIIFLSGTFTHYGFAPFKSNPCLSQVLRGVITMLLREMQSCQDGDTPHQVSLMKRGVILLSFIVTHLSDFKKRRKPVENSYVTLISVLSTLSKQNKEFKDLQETVRELWDFQDDISEFENEEVRNTQVRHPQTSASL